MSVWYCIPSARPDGGTLQEWARAGYKIAVWRDADAPELPIDCVDMLVQDHYPGYAKAVNALIRVAMYNDPSCEWFVTGGDDVSPDLAHSPEEIAAQCSDHFWMEHDGCGLHYTECQCADTFGVMQPTGDRWGADEPWARKNWPNAPAYIDRICGSPWMGREFCRRANAGKGPLHEEFTHMYVDEALQEYAKHLGILWQRPDLIQYHHHALRGPGKTNKDLPEHLKCRYEGDHFAKSKLILDRLKAEKFASCAPIPGLEPIA